MTTDDLTTLLRDHVGADEPAPLLPTRAIRDGRRRVLRRRVATGGAALAVLAVGAAVAVPTLRGDDGDAPSTYVDPATTQALADYDAHRMPQLMDEHVRGVLERSVSDLGRSSFSATDAQGQELPEEYWDKASGLSVSYGGQQHSWTVAISHARSEAEGDPEAYCAEGLAGGYDLSCTVERTDDGAVVITRMGAVKPIDAEHGGGWMAVRADEVSTIIPLDRLWFDRTVKVIKSETLLTYVSERVKANDRDPGGIFSVPGEDLIEIGLDPVMVMPEPPPGDDGCDAWIMESEEFQVSCSDDGH